MTICSVSLHAWPVVFPEVGRPVGGTETRSWLFARGLAELGERVDFVVRGDAQATRQRVDDVQIVPIVDRWHDRYQRAGLHVTRRPTFPYGTVNRWGPALLWDVPLVAAHQMLSRKPSRIEWPADVFDAADVFLTWGVQSTSAAVISEAHHRHRKAVLMIGSDGDLDERYRPDSDYVSPYGDRAAVCHGILMQADAIVAQTEEQRQMLRERFGRDCDVLRNPIDLDAWDQLLDEPPPDEVRDLTRYVLWVGRAEAVHKRPQLFVELAKRHPKADFVMVLNPRDPDVERDVRQQCPPNLRILPHVPFSQMPALFRRAAAFVSTSALEGFPNVFLQAAATNVPILSLSVGREFLEASAAGHWCDGPLEELSERLGQQWNSPQPPPPHAREFVTIYHGLRSCSEVLRQVLRGVARSATGDS